MLKVCRKTRIRDVEQGDDKLISKKEAINQKPAENDLKKMDFVDDKYIENFETLENKAISLELRLEDINKELADLILNNNRNNLLEDKINKFEPRVEKRIKTLEDMIKNRTKKLEDKLNIMEDKLNTILDYLKSNK